MEVHHHSHTERKKWTHYFWEFLMLFLAVFCGFLAEYKLEHTIEHNRERQYIKSFIEDLKIDTSFLDIAIEIRGRRVKVCDSLIKLLKSSDRPQYTGTIYLLGLRLSSSNRFGYSDRTIQQLRNAGGMRLIRAKGVSDSIMGYDIMMRRMQLDEDQSLDILKEYRATTGKVFDASVFLSITDSVISTSHITTINPKLLTTDPEAINNLCVQLLFYRRANASIKSSLINLSAMAGRLIENLEKEYHIK